MSEKHYYPGDLAAALRARWLGDNNPAPGLALPETGLLTSFISVAYQASLLTEEGQPVTCRLLLAPPEALADQPPAGTSYHLLAFGEARPCNQQEIRRLSPAATVRHNLRAVRAGAPGTLLIWGLLSTSCAWDHLAESTSPARPHLPAALIIQVQGPGSLIFYCGDQRMLTLRSGQVDGHGFLNFPAAWWRKRFQKALAAVQLEWAADGPPGERAAVENALVVGLTQRAIGRAIAQVQAKRHGGLLVFIPPTALAQRVGPAGLLRPKYRMQPGSMGHQYRNLLFAVIARLAALGPISWENYQQITDALLLGLQTELSHFADLLADLMAVDGALVVTHRLEVVGFGVEVRASQLSADQVWRALDIEAAAVAPEPANRSGTRHRAAYRLCLSDPACLAIVVSQDGGVQFVHHQAGKVIFWDQLSL